MPPKQNRVDESSDDDFVKDIGSASNSRRSSRSASKKAKIALKANVEDRSSAEGSDDEAKKEQVISMHPELASVWDDLRDMADLKVPEDFVQPPDVTVKLLPFQIEGATRETSKAKLMSYDIVLSTYAIVENSFRKENSGFKRQGKLVKEKSLIHSIDWGRVVLDEAHAIKDRSCSTARAVFNLKCRYKWSLSGTPLQNRVGELYSLIRFLNAEILKPIQKYGGAGEGLVAFRKLGLLLDKIMLRRTKLERADDLGLPPRVISVRRDVFNEAEEELYESLYSDSRRQFSTYVAANTVLNNYASIFSLLSRMRLAVNHPDLVTSKLSLTDKLSKTLVCGICQDEAEDPILSKCKHVFCREDIRQYLLSFPEGQKVTCPTCYKVLSIDLSQEEYENNLKGEEAPKVSIINQIDMSKWRSSTKIEALVEELDALQKQDSTLKSIVFSQFVAFLDLIQWRLTRAGFSCVKLDGRMSPEARNVVISNFMTDPTVTIFLVSLKAGGVALNLTEASRVFKNSIESRILQLQEKKKMLFQSTVGKDIDALAKMTFAFSLFFETPICITRTPTSSTAFADTSFLQKSMYQGISTQGCTKILDGKQDGVLYSITSESEVDIFSSSKDLFTKYAVVMPFNMFTPSVLSRLKNSGKLSGVIVIQQHPDFPRPASFSPDVPFPNFKYSLYSNTSGAPHPWNPNGNGLLFENYDFPIFLMPSTPNDSTGQQATGTIIEGRSYSSYPLYAIEFDDFMHAAVDAETCLRRGWCSPIGGISSWATYSYNISRLDDRRLVIVTAPIESNSFFRNGNAWGAGSTASAFVGLLAVADALSQLQPSIRTLPKDIVFTLFGSEEFGFAGSQRFVKDMTQSLTCLDTKKADYCKVSNPACTQPCVPSTNYTELNFEKIDAIVEFSQVAGIGLTSPLDQSTVFMHVDDSTSIANLDLLDKFRGSFQFRNIADGANVSMQFADAFSPVENNRLPPSSSMSFLAKKKIPAVVFGDYRSQYNNKFFNSEFDDGSTWSPQNAAYLCGVATRAAQGIFKVAGGSDAVANGIAANCTLVSEMFTCFTRNISCDYLSNFYNISQQRRNFLVASQFQGTFEFSDSVGFIPFYTQQILANATAVNRAGACKRGKCDENGPSFQCIAGSCVETQAQIHFAYGTGLEFNYNLRRFEVVDFSKASYVESSWSSDTLRIRTFKTASPAYQAVQLVIGIALTASAIGAIIFAQKYAAKAFKTE
ncbi:DNA repair protein rad16 [Dinochytrium kinnereticum]|nr:DNA repair protein rad16 [Dinochytrium kinnereticum]